MMALKIVTDFQVVSYRSMENIRDSRITYKSNQREKSERVGSQGLIYWIWYVTTDNAPVVVVILGIYMMRK